MNSALVVIDIQNDYFPGGKFELWNTEEFLRNVEQLLGKAREKGLLIIHVQHIANKSGGVAPFFNIGTEGVLIHPRVLAAAPDAPIVAKEHADSFLNTNLESLLSGAKIEHLYVCGAMTHNCVTHTAISKAAEKYDVTVLNDCCTSVSEMVHLISLNALADRVKVRASIEAIG